MGKSTVFTALGETKESQHDPFDATYAMIELRQHTVGPTVQMSKLDDMGSPQGVLGRWLAYDLDPAHGFFSC